jgi:outer membrane protein assembly factor BamB
MRIASLVFLCCCALLASPAAADDWSAWRGSARDGVAHNSPPLIEELPPGGLQPHWIAPMGHAERGGWSSPVIADGKVYLFTHVKTKVSDENLAPQKFPYLSPDKRVGMNEQEYEQYESNRRDEQQARSKAFRYTEHVDCLDAQTGEPLWRHEQESVYTRFPQSGTPLVADGRLYILGAGQMVRAIDATTGKSLWNTRLPGDFRDEHLHSSLALADGAVCILADSLFGLDAAGGELLWQGDEANTSGRYTSPVVWSAGGRPMFIVNVAKGETIAVEPRTGKEYWRIQSEGQRATPLVIDRLLITYGQSRKQGLRAFDLTQNPPVELWKYQGAADSGSSPVVVGGQIYVQGEKRLACVDLKTGKAQWTTLLDIGNPRYTSLIAADGKVFYAFDGVLCFAADPQQYTGLYDAKVNREGLLAEQDELRKLLKLDELERTAEGQKEAERVWRREVESEGVLSCATPAIADGKLYLRLKKQLVCYDLRK